MDNTMSYATRTLANHMAGMAAQIGIQQQKIDELSQANQILKDQLKQKEGNVNDAAKHDADDGQADGQPTKATSETK